MPSNNVRAACARGPLWLCFVAANPAALIGGGFIRIPADATPHYTTWANTNTPDQLWLDQFRECTVLMPTWLLPRGLFDTVGLFKESAPAVSSVKQQQQPARVLELSNPRTNLLRFISCTHGVRKALAIGHRR